jgi:hypothetical protein
MVEGGVWIPRRRIPYGGRTTAGRRGSGDRTDACRLGIDIGVVGAESRPSDDAFAMGVGGSMVVAGG